ncbi:hypothetical protein ACH9EU_02350 [Kocuria sp. M1R5S2]|uniref:hypothetical protein n=1 Tax=Kocuria rhizosphaerae TaxID=3376285 RepID=UPI00378F632D
MPGERVWQAGQVPTGPETRALRRSLLAWLLVVVALVTAVTSALNWVLVDREPEDPVAVWLAGIEDGRSRQLLSRAEAVRTQPSLDVVPNRVYRNAAGRISGHEILEVRRSGTRAEVRALVWWDADERTGERREEVHTWGVHQVERSGPFNDTWELDSPDAAPLSIHLPATLDEISVNGESIRIDDDQRVPDPRGPGGTWRFEALPGDYSVGLPGNSYYRAAGPPVRLSLPFRHPRPADAALRLEPSPRMWRETEDRIGAWLEDCMDSDELVPERCPGSQRHVGEPGGSTGTDGPSGSAGTATQPPGPAGTVTPAPEPSVPEITAVRWQLLSRPALVLVSSPGDPLRWNADPYRPAVAELSYREDGEPVTERVEFPVTASVRSTGQTARIEVGPR